MILKITHNKLLGSEIKFAGDSSLRLFQLSISLFVTSGCFDIVAP